MKPIVAALLALLAAGPAAAADAKAPPPDVPATVTPEPSASDSPCTGTLTGTVTANFSCTVKVTKKNGTVGFEVTPVGKVKGLKRFPPVTFVIQAPVTVQTYAHRDLVSASASVETSDGKKLAASGKLADRGDLEVQVGSMEMSPGRHPLTQMHVHAHLVPVSAKDKAEIQLDVQLETTW